MILRSLHHRAFRVRWNPFPVRNFAYRMGKRYFADQPFKEIPKDDPIRNPFRAYKDPRYYTKVMGESNTQGAKYREIFDISLYLKEGRWSLFDAFVFGMVGTFFMWRSSYVPWMEENFTYYPGQLTEGRYHTLFTNFISHNGKWHLAANVACVWGLAQMMRGACSLNLLFGSFLLAGQAGNVVAHMRQNQYIPQLGASAGVCSLLGTLAVFMPWRTFLVWLPLGKGWQRNFLWRLVGLGVAFDFLGCFYRHSKLGHDAHLAGYAVGIASGLVLKKYHVKVPINHLWRKPVFKIQTRPPLWNQQHWDKLHAQGRGGGINRVM